MTRRTRTVAAVTAAAALAAPVAASAHVTVDPREAEAGSFSFLTVRVPNERDDKGTTRVSVRLPRGVFSLSYKRVPGWKAVVTNRALAEPVDLGEFSVDERYTRVVWTARRGTAIRPGQYEEFPLSVRVPDGEPGAQLVFPSLQTYAGGERVRWTGAPESGTPAPRVTLAAPAEATAALAGPLAGALLR
jgi:uncharacterized protein YcnI